MQSEPGAHGQQVRNAVHERLPMESGTGAIFALANWLRNVPF